MKQTKQRGRPRRLASAVTGLSALVAAHAGTVTLNFSTNPATDGTYIEPGTTSAEWRQDGGASGAAGDGYLSITDARDSQSGVVLFKDLEPGLVVKAFSFECDLRIGGGDNQPADGFSLNYVRDTDPIVQNIINGTGNPFAGTDNEPGAGDASDSGAGTGTGLPEEGCSTGLGIGFDTWQSATINGVQDVVGISIRVDARLIAQLPVPLKPGNVFTPDEPNPGAQGAAYEYNDAPYRNLAKTDPNYASSMQTGALSDEDLNGDGTVGNDAGSNQPPYGDPAWGLWIKNLGWEKFKAELTEAGTVKVWWKGVELTPAGGLPTTFTPSPGRIVFAGRTGGNNEVHHVDNIVLTTVAADNIIVGNATGNPVGFRILLIDSGPAVVDPNTIALKLDGVDVPAQDLSKTGGNTSVGWFDVTKPLVAGSVHTVAVTVKDTRGLEVSETRDFTVPAYVTLPTDYAVLGVTQPGFSVAVHQTAQRFQETTVARAEQQLNGLRGANVADLTGFTGGVYAESAVINYSQVGAGGVPEPAGIFQDNTGFPDVGIPGIPSQTESNPDGTPYTDNVAAEITTYLQFPEAGVYHLIFNSDDGFRTTAFKGNKEVLTALVIGQADVGRGATDTSSVLYVPQAGAYGLRTVWFEGGGGANLEWSSEQTAPKTVARTLLNDPTSTVKAFRSTTTAAPAAVTFTHPFRDSGNPYLPTIPLIAKVQDGPTAVDQNSIRLLLNGAELTTTKNKAGSVTTVTHDPAANLPAGTNELKVTFTADGVNYEGMTSFTVRNVPVVPPSLALPASAVVTANVGFLVKTRQEDSYTDLGVRGTDTYAAESQIHGLLALPDFADLTLFTGPQGHYVETDVINYYSTGDVGYFADANGYPNAAVPGIPGKTRADGTTTADNGTDGYSQEILTVLNLQPGQYAMNVASDDGFIIMIGNPNEWWTLPLVVGEFNAGRGAGLAIDSGTFFYFQITQAGLYPFRLLWHEGGGGSSVEWSSRELNSDTGHVGTATLINDSLVTTSIKAYQYPLTSPGAPYVKSFAPGRDGRSSTASLARSGNDAEIKVVIEQGTATLSETSVSLMVDNAAVTPTATKVGTELRVNYRPAAPWTDGVHTAALTFGDRTVNWSFRTGSAMKTPAFFIEAEDFDNNGQGQAAASQMPYAGGAYAGLTAVAGTDYQRADSASSPLYRFGVNPRVSMDRTGDRDRGLVDVSVNYKLGWIGAGQWYNYTRDLPAGQYNVYAAISHGDGATSATRIGGNLARMTGGTESVLGAFGGPATGGWGNNALLPLMDAASTNTMVAVDLGGPTTLRFNTLNGDWDFMLLVPAGGGEVIEITHIKRNSDGTITVTWTGGGTLQAAPTVTGPWENVTGATSPYTFTPTTAVLFGRIMK